MNSTKILLNHTDKLVIVDNLCKNGTKYSFNRRNQPSGLLIRLF